MNYLKTAILLFCIFGSQTLFSQDKTIKLQNGLNNYTGCDDAAINMNDESNYGNSNKIPIVNEFYTN